MRIFRKDSRFKYRGKWYVPYRDFGGLIAVFGQEDHKSYLVFNNSQGDVKELADLGNTINPLEANFLREIFPEVIEIRDYLNSHIVVVRRGDRKYLLVYKGTLVDEGNALSGLNSIHEISDGDLVITYDQGICNIIPLGINKIFKIGGDKIVEMFLCTGGRIS